MAAGGDPNVAPLPHASFLDRLNHIPWYTGEASTTELWIESLENVQRSAHLSNKELAIAAVSRFHYDSAVYLWYSVLKDEGRHPNIDIWFPEDEIPEQAPRPGRPIQEPIPEQPEVEADPDNNIEAQEYRAAVLYSPAIPAFHGSPHVPAKMGGLKAALLMAFPPYVSKQELTNQLKANLVQRKGERVEVYKTRLDYAQNRLEQVLFPPGMRLEKWLHLHYHDSFVYLHMTNGLRPQVLKAAEAISYDDVNSLLAACQRFQQTTEGRAELINGPTQPQNVGIMNQIQPVKQLVTSAVLQPAPNRPQQQAVIAAIQKPKQQPKPKKSNQKKQAASVSTIASSSTGQCSYCGINNHRTADCRIKKNDMSKGLHRTVHPNFPLKTRFQRRTEFNESGVSTSSPVSSIRVASPEPLKHLRPPWALSSSEDNFSSPELVGWQIVDKAYKDIATDVPEQDLSE